MGNTKEAVVLPAEGTFKSKVATVTAKRFFRNITPWPKGVIEVGGAFPGCVTDNNLRVEDGQYVVYTEGDRCVAVLTTEQLAAQYELVPAAPAQ